MTVKIMLQILCNNYFLDVHVQLSGGVRSLSFTILILSVLKQQKHRGASLSEPWLFADAISTVSFKVGQQQSKSYHFLTFYLFHNHRLLLHSNK